jgi:hypothetical protein
LLPPNVCKPRSSLGLDSPSSATPNKKMPYWRITRLRARAEFLGYVEAPDEKAAIEVAAKQFEISPELQNRLVAQRPSMTRVLRMSIRRAAD